MIRKMEEGVLLSRYTITDEYNELVEQWERKQEPIILAVSVATGATGTVNEVLSVSSTHTGLTKDKRPKPQDVIVVGNQAYRVDYVITSSRYTQLMLTQENQI